MEAVDINAAGNVSRIYPQIIPVVFNFFNEARSPLDKGIVRNGEVVVVGNVINGRVAAFDNLDAYAVARSERVSFAVDFNGFVSLIDTGDINAAACVLISDSNAVARADLNCLFVRSESLLCICKRPRSLEQFKPRCLVDAKGIGGRIIDNETAVRYGRCFERGIARRDRNIRVA